MDTLIQLILSLIHILYKQEDKFISCMTNTIEEYVIKKENETKSKITINVADARGNSTLQNSQVDKFLSENYDIICVNIVRCV